MADATNNLFDFMVWPTSLEQWRQYPPFESPETEYNLQFWTQMEAKFALQGVRLYKPDFETGLPLLRTPPDDDGRPVPPDVHETEPGSHASVRNMQQPSASVYPAVLANGNDMIVRVVSKGSPPSRQLDILRYLSQEKFRSDPRYHAITIVQELVFQDWVFVVMPRLSPAAISDTSTVTKRHWFTTLSEIIDCVVQILEGFEFLHDHLIAHQDIAATNIVVNHLGDHQLGFLSRFPCRYYIIDFEVAIQFQPDSKPAERKVVGPPIENFTLSRLAPEIGALAHCPFRADVWQLGMLLFRAFPTQSEHIARIARRMLSPEPDARPSMRDADNAIRDARRNLSDEELASPVCRNFVFDRIAEDRVPAELETFLKGGSIDVRSCKYDE